MRSLVRPILLVGLLVLAAPLRAAEPPVIVILPFEVASAERLDYLQETLVHLLAARMAEGGRVTVVRPRKVMETLQGHAGRQLTDQEARDLGKSFGARYVLVGRFTALGEGFRLDGRLLDVASDREIDHVTVSGDRLGGLMPRVGELANALAQHFPAAVQPPSPTVGSVAPPAGATAGVPRTVSPAPPAGTPGPAAVAPGPSWVSRRLALEIRGIGIGDVDGDGTNEIVVLAKREIRVYRRNGSDLTVLASYPFSGGLEALGVDVADLNGNGVAEVYVTALGPGGGLASFVVEWAGNTLQPIATNVPWYLRVVDLQGGPALVGQRRSSDKAFDGPIRRLVWQGGKLGGEDLRLPGHVTVYSFAVGDLEGDGQAGVVSVQPRAPLTLYDGNGSILGRGGAYGQTKLWIVAKRSRNEDLEEGVHLPGRVLIVQLPGQGPTVLLSRNNEVFGVLDRLRTFRDGEIVGLRLRRGEVNEIGHTERFAYVADFQVGTLENGREPLLVVASVTSFDGVFGSAASYLTVMPLRTALRQ
jgi:TolB-like protein